MSLPISEEDHTLGPPNAEVTLVEYGDIECPSTGGMLDIIARLRAAFPQNLRYVFRHFPITDNHPHSVQAAEAAECASAQGKFWEMLEMMLSNQRALDPRSIFDYVDQLGLDRMQMALQLGKRRFLPRIQRDVESGVLNGIENTPALFLNGMKYSGPLTLEAISQEIEQLIGCAVKSKVRTLSSRRAS